MKKGIAPLAAALIVVLLAAAAVVVLTKPQQQPGFGEQSELKKFTSEAELKNFLNSTAQQSYFYGGIAVRAQTLEAATQAEGAAAPSGTKANADDYSATNIQIEGVDEADFVKNDGKYIYTISGSNVVIVDAYPAEDAKIVSAINLSGQTPQEIYVNGDRLVVFGNVYDYGYPVPLIGVAESGASSSGGTGVATSEIAIARPDIGILPPVYSYPTTYIKIYDISDRSNPVLARNLEFNGTYFNSRMIGDYVYAIVNAPAYYVGDTLPTFSPAQRAFPEIYYFPVPDYSYQFTNILSVNVKDDTKEIENKVFLLGYSSSLFVSQDNIYLVYQKQVDQNYFFDRVIDEIILPVAPPDIAARVNEIRNSDKPSYQKQYEIEQVLQEWREQLGPEEAAQLQKQFEEKYANIQRELAKELEKSVVHKVSVDNGKIEYRTKGEVPGYPLNQFSMDEYGGYFRIATTTNNFGSEPSNHIYVMDGNMNIVGKAEDLAPGERIFSARFIGNRAYLVTFVRIDPLFVIDLSDPTNPKVLGELKIPGVSDYLHPYDETHLIGVGRSTQEFEDRIMFKGLKLSLFDVSDVSNPKEIAKYEIGDRGTNSQALYDHKAFLFSKERNLLVLPVDLYEMKSPDEFYGQFTWQGVYVFKLTLENGFEFQGRVTHVENPEREIYNYWPYTITRSLYMDNVLYTLSQKMIKANDLNDISEINKVALPGAEEYPWKIY